MTSGRPSPPTERMARSTSSSPNRCVVTSSSGKRFDAEQDRNGTGAGGAIERNIDALAAGDSRDARERVFLLHIDDVIGAEFLRDVHARSVLGRAGDDN